MDYGRPATAAEPSDPAVVIHDRGWIPAPPGDVYGVVHSVETYSSWWPSVSAEPPTPGEHLLLTIPGLGALRTAVQGDRPGLGLIIQLRGDVEGVLEWFLEPFKEGAIANVLLRLAERPRRWKRRELTYRSAVRDGLVALRRMFEDRATARERREARSGGQ